MEYVFLPPTLRLLNPRQTTDVRSPINGRADSIKEDLIQEEDEEPADRGETSADPETPAPGRPGHNERGDQRPQIGAQDDGKLNVVDDSYMFVEAEEVLDPHQRSPLPHAAEEAINDAGGEVGVKTGGGCRPDAGADHDALEEKGDGQAPEETGEGDDEEATHSDGEEIADNRALHGGLRQMPLAMMIRLLIARPSTAASDALSGTNVLGLRNDRDNCRAAGVVGQRSNVCDNCYHPPFLSGAPIEGIVVGVERLGNQHEAVGALLQSFCIVRIATWIDEVAFERLPSLVDHGSSIRRRRFEHGCSVGAKRRKSDGRQKADEAIFSSGLQERDAARDRATLSHERTDAPDMLYSTPTRAGDKRNGSRLRI